MCKSVPFSLYKYDTIMTNTRTIYYKLLSLCLKYSSENIFKNMLNKMYIGNRQ